MYRMFVIVFFQLPVKHSISLGQKFFSDQWTCCSLLNPAYASDRLLLSVWNPQNCTTWTTLAQRILSYSSNLHLTIEQAPRAAANASGNFRSLSERPKLRNWRRSCTANCMLHCHPALCSLAPLLRLPKTKGRAAALNFLMHWCRSHLSLRL